MDNFEIELIIAKKNTLIKSRNEFRKVLKEILIKQVSLKYGISGMQGYKFIGAVFLNNRQIKFNLPSLYSDRNGLPVETLSEYFTRINPKQLIDDLIQKVETDLQNRETLSINLLTNIFDNRKESSSGSIFTDLEVIGIANKINCPHVRFLLKNLKESMTDLHEIVMEFYKIYGGYVLTYLLSLPPIKFADSSVYEIKDYSNRPHQLPTLTFKSNPSAKFELSILFYPPIKNKSNGFRVASIVNSNSKIVGTIQSDGFVFSELKSFKPKLSLFIKSTPESMSIYCGSELGCCNYCKAKLEDPISIKWGYGKQCAEKLGLPYF